MIKIAHSESGGARADLDTELALPGENRTTTVVADYLDHNKVYHVDDYGALSTDEATRTTAVQAAINAAWAVGGVVQFGPKEYRLGNITLPTTALDSRRALTFRGSGVNTGIDRYNEGDRDDRYATRLVFTKTDGTHFLEQAPQLDHNGNVYRFENLAIIGPDTLATTTSGDAVHVESANGVSILEFDHVLVSMFRGGTGIYAHNVENSVWNTVRVRDCKWGYDLSNAFNANVLINCGAEACLEYGMYVSYSTSTVIVGGVIQSNYRTGLYMEGCVSWTVNSLHFENNNRDGGPYYALHLYGTTNANGAGGPNTHVTFHDCNFASTSGDVLITGDGTGPVDAAYITIHGGFGGGIAHVTLGSGTKYCRIEDFAAIANVTDLGINNSVRDAGIDYRTGPIQWGPTADATDVNLYRSAANTLKTDDNLVVAGGTVTVGTRALTATQLTDLTDGGDSALHFHPADRSRANHTGTQSLSTISGGTAGGSGYTFPDLAVVGAATVGTDVTARRAVLGATVPTQGGRAHLMDDGGTVRWQVGIGASAGGRDWIVWDLVANLPRLTVDATTGKTTIAGPLAHTGTAAGFFNVTPAARPAALVQTYNAADRTLGAYTADAESTAYTGQDNAQAGTVYPTLTDVNALRVAYENLRAFVEDLAQHHNALVDDLQTLGLEQ